MLKRQLLGLGLLVSFVWLAEAAQAQTGYVGPDLAVPQLQIPPPAKPSLIEPGGYLPTGPAVQPGVAESSSQATNPMLWQQYQALQFGDLNAGGENCGTCGSSSYDRCGCNTQIFPWTPGRGSVDQWCVGPKWAVDANGLFLFREDADWASVIATVPGGTVELEDQFEHGPGARLFVTGYNEAGFGIQVGYEGVNDFNANLEFAPVAGVTRDFDYESSLNSIEINFLPHVPYAWKWYSGFRYVELSEDFLDSTTVAKTVPAPATPAVSSTFTDSVTSQLLKNRLFGFQLGARRDAWNWGNRLSLQTFANAGVYCNKFRRDDLDVTVTTTISGDDTATADMTEFSNTNSTFVTATRQDILDIAFLGEAGLTAAWRLNQVTALRAGYQVLLLDGVGQGLTASLSPGLNSSTLVYHGLQFGIEYRR